MNYFYHLPITAVFKHTSVLSIKLIKNSFTHYPIPSELGVVDQLIPKWVVKILNFASKMLFGTNFFNVIHFLQFVVNISENTRYLCLGGYIFSPLTQFQALKLNLSWEASHVYCNESDSTMLPFYWSSPYRT